MFARPEDLIALAGQGGRAFEELLYDLVVAEASRHGIPLSAIRWDHRTNIGDGGRDIIVAASHTDPVRFIPQGPSIWSAKSGKDGTQPGTLRQELTDPRHAEVRQHLQAGKPYVWCTLQPMTEDEQLALRAKAGEVASDLTACIFNPALVEFRGLTTLCTVLNDNPGLILKHLPHIARVFEGVLTFAEWEAQDRAGFGTPFIDFAARSQVVTQLRAHLRDRSQGNVLHLAGLSGVGKTRTVLEACRAERDLSGILYLPRRADIRDSLIRHLTRSTNLLALVVIDEVPLEDLTTLTSQFESFSHRLRFVTIGPARRNERGRSSANILVLPEPDTREGVLQVVRAAGAGISEPVLESIARFSSHDLRLALMLVEATRTDGTLRDLPIQDGEDVWRRVTGLFRTRLGDLNAFQTHYPYLTVSVDIGVQGELRHELQRVAEQFAVPPERLDEAIAFALPCGLGIQSTDFFEPTPRALAGHLFRQRVWNALKLRLSAFLGGLPDRLLRRFMERCQECVGPEREEMEEAVARFFQNELGPPDVTRLIDRGRSRLFKAWAELDPFRGLGWLREAVENASEEQLSSLDGAPDGSGGWRGRRQVVWLCEALASFADYFWTCEAVLFRLAQVETEPSIGNNATAIWRGAFLPVLSFTEIPFRYRAAHLLRRLASSDEQTLRLVFSAVSDALSGYIGGRMVPPTIVGGRIVPEPWRPATYTELYDIQREFGKRSLETVARLPAPLLALGLHAVAAHLQDYVRLGLVAELRATLEPGDEELRQVLRRELRRLLEWRDGREVGVEPDPMLPELRRWEESLRPNDLAGRVKELTSLEAWEAMRGRTGREVARPSPYEDLAQSILAKPDVIKELEDWFCSEKPRSAFNLAAAVGELDQAESLHPTIVAWIDGARCPNVVAGYLRGIAKLRGVLSSEWTNRLEQAAKDHPRYAAVLTADADFSEAGFRRIMRLVDSGSMPPRLLRTFVYPHWEPKIQLQERLDILQLLSRLQDTAKEETVGVALLLASTWTSFGKKPLPSELAGPVIRILHASLDVRGDPNEWSILFESLIATNPQEAADLAAEALTSHGPLRVTLQDLILPPLLALARTHPRMVMEAIGQRILDPARRPFFSLLSFQGLFDAIGLGEVQRWLGQHEDMARYIARHLSSPRIQDGSPVIPVVTDWVMTEFEGDDRVFTEYFGGRHAFQIREGHARDRRAELEQSLQPFRSHEKAWIRRWAEYELRENEWEAKMDDQLDDRMERT
ncbi:MAG: hypothetical protein U0793_05050 [Gemmataceae bacterium]